MARKSPTLSCLLITLGTRPTQRSDVHISRRTQRGPLEAVWTVVVTSSQLSINNVSQRRAHGMDESRSLTLRSEMTTGTCSTVTRSPTTVSFIVAGGVGNVRPGWCIERIAYRAGWKEGGGAANRITTVWHFLWGYKRPCMHSLGFMGANVIYA